MIGIDFTQFVLLNFITILILLTFHLKLSSFFNLFKTITSLVWFYLSNLKRKELKSINIYKFWKWQKNWDFDISWIIFVFINSILFFQINYIKNFQERICLEWGEGKYFRKLKLIHNETLKILINSVLFSTHT